MNGDNGAPKAPTARKRRRRPRFAFELAPLLQPLRRPPAGESNGASGRPAPREMDPIVVEWLWTHRLATGFQLERRFPQWFTSPTTTRRHLTRLKRLRYIKPIAMRGVATNWPDAFQATGRGLNAVRECYERLGKELPVALTADPWKAKGVSGATAFHELVATEVDLDVEMLAQQYNNIELLDVERRWRRRPLGKVKPDSRYVLACRRRGRGWSLLAVFVEVHNGTSDGPRIAEKFDNYRQWAESADGEAWLARLATEYGYLKPADFCIWFIGQDKSARGRDNHEIALAFAQLIDKPRFLRERVFLIAGSDYLDATSRGECVPAGPLWLRPLAIAEFRRICDSVAHLERRTADARLLRFVRGRLLDLSRHAALNLAMHDDFVGSPVSSVESHRGT